MRTTSDVCRHYVEMNIHKWRYRQAPNTSADHDQEEMARDCQNAATVAPLFNVSQASFPKGTGRVHACGRSSLIAQAIRQNGRIKSWRRRWGDEHDRRSWPNSDKYGGVQRSPDNKADNGGGGHDEKSHIKKSCRLGGASDNKADNEGGGHDEKSHINKSCRLGGTSDNKADNEGGGHYEKSHINKSCRLGGTLRRMGSNRRRERRKPLSSSKRPIFRETCHRQETEAVAEAVTAQANDSSSQTSQKKQTIRPLWQHKRVLPCSIARERSSTRAKGDRRPGIWPGLLFRLADCI